MSSKRRIGHEKSFVVGYKCTFINVFIITVATLCAFYF